MTAYYDEETTMSNDIFQQAATQSIKGKPSRGTAFAIIEQMMDGAGRMENLDEHRENLAKLYAYFMPTLPKKAKTPFQWLAQAAAKNDAREYLRFVYVNGDEAVATDGYRLHLLRHTGWTPGWYNPSTGDGATPPETDRYPDYGRIIPKGNEHRALCDGWTEWPQKEVGPKSVAVQVAEGHWVNREYLAQALQWFDTPTVCYGNEPNSAVVVLEVDATVETADRLAVIMPMRV